MLLEYCRPNRRDNPFFQVARSVPLNITRVHPSSVEGLARTTIVWLGRNRLHDKAMTAIGRSRGRGRGELARTVVSMSPHWMDAPPPSRDNPRHAVRISYRQVE